MQFIQALKNAAKKLETEFEDSKLFTHSGEKGEFREDIINKLIRPFIPERFGIGSGQIFSESGDVSRQIDIVLYDSLFSNVLFKGASSCLFPCESVYGTIEIKSLLNQDELASSVENVRSVKKLNRESSDMLDFLPTVRLNLGDGLTYSGSKSNPYICFLFAYDSIQPKTLCSHLDSHVNSYGKSHLPDFIFSYKKGFMITKIKNQEFAPYEEDFDEYGYTYFGESTLPIMFTAINSSVNGIRLKAPNYAEYLKKLMIEAAWQKEEISKY